MYERLLVDFIWAHQGSRRLRNDGDESLFSKDTRFDRVCKATIEKMIDRKDAYNMQILQDCSAFRWSRITLLSDPAAKLIRMILHVFSDSTLCVGVSNPDPYNNWATKLGCMATSIDLSKY